MKRRDDGLYQKSITINGKRKVFYGKSQSEINKKILAYREGDRQGLKFHTVAEEWETRHFPALKEGSIKTYSPALRRATDYFGDMYIRAITPKDIQLFINKIASMGFAKKTVTNQKNVLNMIMDYAVVQGYIEYNMTASVRLPKGLPEQPREMPTETDIKKVIEYKNTADGFFAYFILCTGLRRGEALALEMKDIKPNYIVVNKTLEHQGNTPILNAPKTKAGNRLVPLPNSLYAETQSRFKGQKYLFNHNGEYMTHKQYNTMWDNWRKLAGSTITAHQLRHAYATLVLRDMDEFDIKEFIGHKDISTTRNIYTHITEKRVISASEQIETIIESM